MGCQGNGWVTCNPVTGAHFVALCSSADPCVEGSCQPDVGCVKQPVADHVFADPADMSEVHLSQWWDEGQLLLLDFSAGWCIVCKNDTAVFNQWLGNCQDDGLRVIQVLYEDPDQTPATQSFANGWKVVYDTQYPVLIDDAILGPDGEAMGGVLESFLQPLGPGLPGYMPIPMLIDTATMEIVYIDTGLNKALFHGLITNFLGVESCY